MEEQRINQELARAILQEIDALLKKEVLPVSNAHLEHLDREHNILEYLLAMKNEGLISGDLVTKGIHGVPHRITNIRLTYTGIRTLRQVARQ